MTTKDSSRASDVATTVFCLTSPSASWLPEEMAENATVLSLAWPNVRPAPPHYSPQVGRLLFARVAFRATTYIGCELLEDAMSPDPSLSSHAELFVGRCPTNAPSDEGPEGAMAKMKERYFPEAGREERIAQGLEALEAARFECTLSDEKLMRILESEDLLD